MHFDHIAINVKDIKKSIEWYQIRLNAKVEYEDETWAMLLIGKTKIALTVSQQHPPHIAFNVRSIDMLPSEPSFHRDGSAYVYECDPDGNTIEYVYWPPKS